MNDKNQNAGNTSNDSQAGSGLTADQMREQWKGKNWNDLTPDQQNQARRASLGPDDFKG